MSGRLSCFKVALKLGSILIRVPFGAAFERTSKLEGLIPALETSHALAYLEDLCPTLADGTNVVVNFSGRGDKDVQTVIKLLGDRIKGGLSTPGKLDGIKGGSSTPGH